MAKDYWNGAYDAINYCNIVINRINDVQGYQSEQEKMSKVAEAYFLRALYYFHLVEQFGAVPLSLQETTAANTEAQRVAPLEIYAQAIIPDLRWAAENLPIDAKVAGRPSKKAALGLLARACLQTKGYGTNEYIKEALTVASELIDNQSNYGIRLYDNFTDNFNEANNK